MSVAAVMLVKDEVDIIAHTLRHLALHVDAIIVRDNMSTDGTWDVLEEFQRQNGRDIHVDIGRDEEVGYYQSRKTTALAVLAMQQGHQWVLPCDADEWWYAGNGTMIRDYLDGIAPDIQVVKAELVNHLPSSADEQMEQNPFLRIGWRLRQAAPIGKVCLRTHPEMHIDMGNHSCWLPGAMMTVPGLIVRHYSWRTEAQYFKKIRNGAAAYANTNLGEGVGGHWQMFGNPPDEDAVRAHFRQWFYADGPRGNSSLIFDPAPLTDEEK